MDMVSIDGEQTIFGIGIGINGYVIPYWITDDGPVSVELDPTSPDIEELVAKLKYLIWG